MKNNYFSLSGNRLIISFFLYPFLSLFPGINDKNTDIHLKLTLILIKKRKFIIY
jgi:hypothetical protein